MTICLGNPPRWTEYGKTYYELRRELKSVGESIVGVQVDIKQSEEYSLLCEGGPHLVGHVETNSIVSGGEPFWEMDNIIVARYRRLLTAEELDS